jgi:hypothetical protein
MGSGASSAINSGNTKPTNNANLLSSPNKARRLSIHIQKNFISQPADGSDLKNYDDALKEVVRLREFANKALEALEGGRLSVFTSAQQYAQSTGLSDSAGSGGQKNLKQKRGAVRAIGKGIIEIENYKRKMFKKKESVKVRRR